jgi:hypothetical protein
VRDLHRVPGISGVGFGPRTALDYAGPDQSFDYGITISVTAVTLIGEFRAHPLRGAVAAATVCATSKVVSYYFD